ncbi:MAG: hypothetical protein EXR72_14130 [Myxococcales bacterium]|nr:hypothetical protein [Myxococcales bacterium]
MIAHGPGAIAALLRRWQAGAVGPEEVKRFAEAALERPPSGAAEREALCDLDLLEVHLLTADDAPALLALLDGGGSADSLAAWRRHRAGIDLDARSKMLRRNKFYRPFCR